MLQALTLKIICAGLLVAGVALIFVPSSQLYHLVATQAPASMLARVVVAIVVVAVSAWALLPLPRKTRGKSISFPDALGQNIIQLNGMERTLARLLARDPEVKWSSVEFEPADDQRRVRIAASVDLFKAASASTREIQARLKDAIANQGRKLLGDDVITGVDLNTRNVIINKKAGFDTPAPTEYPAALDNGSEKKKKDASFSEPENLTYLPDAPRQDTAVSIPETSVEETAEPEALPYGGYLPPLDEESERADENKRSNGL